MDHKRVSLFTIKSRKNNVTFELELPKDIKIYPIFHILFLESTNTDILIQDKLSKLLSENKYEVEKIMDYNVSISQYLIK